MFHSFEHFVIIPTDEDLALTTPQQQESPQNFDKISFLSDQVKKLHFHEKSIKLRKLIHEFRIIFQVRSHLPFLSAFLETQTFSSFIDDTIQSMSQQSVFETPFERRLNCLKVNPNLTFVTVLKVLF